MTDPHQDQADPSTSPVHFNDTGETDESDTPLGNIIWALGCLAAGIALLVPAVWNELTTPTRRFAGFQRFLETLGQVPIAALVFAGAALFMFLAVRSWRAARAADPDEPDQTPETPAS